MTDFRLHLDDDGAVGFELLSAAATAWVRWYLHESWPRSGEGGEAVVYVRPRQARALLKRMDGAGLSVE